MRLVLSSLIVMAGFLSGQAAAAPEQASHADIRDSGFVYCVSIQFAGGSEPGSLLKLYVTTQMEAVGCAVIQHLPAFSQLRHQSIGVGIYIKQSVIQLGR